MIYTDDLPEAITPDALLFADDTKLFRQITSREDAHILQCDIYSLRDWSGKWLLKFNLDKCHVLTSGRRWTWRLRVYGKTEETGPTDTGIQKSERRHD